MRGSAVRNVIVAGFLEGQGSRMLMVRPKVGAGPAGRWRFPMDLVRKKESPEAAMRRVGAELGLQIRVEVGQPPVVADWNGVASEFRYFHCEIVDGSVVASEEWEVRWTTCAELQRLELEDWCQGAAAWLQVEDRDAS